MRLRHLLLPILLGANGLCLAEIQRVEVAPIQYGPLAEEIRTFGVLAPGVEELSFQIPGRIDAFKAEEGDEVVAGQLLAVLNTRDAEDQLRQAENDRANGIRFLKRMETLHAAGSIQASQLEDAAAQYDQVQIAFEQAQLNLARCSLHAPSDGLILKQTTDSRTSIRPGMPIFVFQSKDEAWTTQVDLTDRNALNISKGTTADIRFAPYPNKIFKGRVTSVAQVANSSDGLFTAEVAIIPEDYELRPGMLAEIDLIKTSERGYSSIPFDALLDVRGSRGLVYLIENSANLVREQQVTIISLNKDVVTVAEDLRSFQSVVIRGHYGLQDRSPVLVTQ